MPKRHDSFAQYGRSATYHIWSVINEPCSNDEEENHSSHDEIESENRDELDQINAENYDEMETENVNELQTEETNIEICDEMNTEHRDELQSDRGSEVDSTDSNSDGSHSDVPDDDEIRSSSSDSDTEDNDEDEDEAPAEDENNLPVFPGAPLTMVESILAILVFALRHKISGTCLADLLKLLSIHFPAPNRLLKTLYRFRKYFNNVKTPLVRHYYCSNCASPLLSVNSRCTSCAGITSASYFLEIPILHQLQTLFKRPGFYKNLNNRFTRVKQVPENLEDIYDGTVYQSLYDNGFLGNPSNISFTWNTDGIPLFKSSKFNIWPFYLVINELSYTHRMKRENLILAGIWFGDKKPKANLYMNIFREPLRKLYRGIDFEVPDVGNVRVRGILICGTCDLPAKALFLNMIEYNGTFGSQKCKIQTVKVENTRVYPYKAQLDIRTTEETIVYAREALDRGESVKGVRGPTVLSQISHDFIGTTVIDAMHCVYLGIVKKMITLWFDGAYSSTAWSLYRYRKLVDERITTILPPDIVQRFPRKISEISYWKASELKTWLFYYSIPILYDIMGDEYFKHHVLLVFGICLLNEASVSIDMINRASIALKEYVAGFEKLYMLRHMTANLHLLLHLPDTVKSFGPLWVTSCFPFEDANGMLKSLVHGTRYAPLQILSSVSIFFHLSELKSKYVRPESDLEKFCNYMEKKNRHRRKATSIENKIFLIGTVQKLTRIPIAIQNALARNGITIGDSTYSFTRLLKNGIFYNSALYKRLRKYNSSFVTFYLDNAEKIGIIHTFIKIRDCHCDYDCQNCEHDSFWAIIIKCDVVNIFSGSIPNSTVKSIFQCHQLDNENMVAIPINQLKSVCFHARVNGDLYVMKPVNTVEFE